MLLSRSVVEDMMVLAQFEIQVAQFWRSLPNCASFNKENGAVPGDLSLRRHMWG
jgi:hypothetical protein